MSDDDLWRPQHPPERPGDESDEDGQEPPGDLDMTQPIGGSAPSPPPAPPSPPGPSYDTTPGPGAVPPPANPYGQAQPGPYGAPYGGQAPPPTNPYPTGSQPYGAPQNPYQPPPNPYPQPQEYGTPQNPYGVPYQPAYAGGLQPDHPSATTAMVLGIIGLVGILFCAGLTLVLSPFAWATGAKAVREIDRQPGVYGGRDKAQAGKWMGIIGTILLVLGVLLVALLVVVGVAVSNDPTGGTNGGTFQNS